MSEETVGATPSPPISGERAGVRGGGAASRAAVFDLQFAPGLPLVAVGAPAATFYPRVARGLAVPLILPQHAAVANALGAVLGEVSQRVHVVVSQPVRGVFRVFTREGPRDFSELILALEHARQLASDEAKSRALQAGAVSAEVRLSQLDNAVSNDIDGNVFFEAQITATASGPPWTRSALRHAELTGLGETAVAPQTVAA